MLAIAIPAECVYLVVWRAMAKLSRQYPSYILLLSQGISDMGLILLFAYTGIGTLVQGDILGDWTYYLLNVFWYPLIYHFSLVAVNRTCALVFYQQYERWFTWKVNLGLGIGAWVVGVCQKIAIIIIKGDTWDYIFIPERWGYGFKYNDVPMTDPVVTSYWFTYNNSGIVIPAALYAFAALASRFQSAAVQQSPARRRAEFRITISCAVNCLVLFLQNLFTNYLYVQGPWGHFLQSLSILLNSAVNPIILLIISPTVREEVWKLLKRNSNAVEDIALSSSSGHRQFRA